MLVGAFCTFICSATLAIIPNTGYDPNSTGTVTLLGHPIGKYVDDEQPNQCTSVQNLLDQGVTLVIAGQAPESHNTCPGAVNADEYYPFDCRYYPGAWGRMPRAPVLILQDLFAWPSCKPPTRRQRRGLLKTAAKDHAKLAFRY